MTKVNQKTFKLALDGTGGIMLSIAKNLGVTRHAVYDFCNKHPDMMQLRRDEEDKILDIAENGLFTKAKDKDPWAIKYLLSTKGKKRGYVEKTESAVEHTGEQIKIIIEEKIPEGGKNDKLKQIS